MSENLEDRKCSADALNSTYNLNEGHDTPVNKNEEDDSKVGTLEGNSEISDDSSLESEEDDSFSDSTSSSSTSSSSEYSSDSRET